MQAVLLLLSHWESRAVSLKCQFLDFLEGRHFSSPGRYLWGIILQLFNLLLDQLKLELLDPEAHL